MDLDEQLSDAERPAISADPLDAQGGATVRPGSAAAAVHRPQSARPLEPTPNQPTPSAPPLDPEAPVPDDPGPLEEPELLPPPPLEPSPDVVPQAEPV